MKKLLIKIGIINAFLISAILVFSVGCKKEDTPNYNGNWSGKTSQNEDISFTVSNNSVTHLEITVVTTWATVQIGTTYNCSISNNSFSMTGVGYPAVHVSGKFSSNTASGGTFDYSSTTGTWTATKQ